MDLSYREIDKFKVVDVGGKLSGSDADAFESALRSLVDQGNQHVVVNLSDIKSLPGRSVSALRTLWKKMVDTEGSVCVIASEQKVCRALLSGGMNMLMPVYSSEELFLREAGKEREGLVHLSTYERGQYTVVNIKDPISIFSGYHELDRVLSNLFSGKKMMVALNFLSGDYFYSEIVGLMNKWSWKLKKDGGELCLLGIDKDKRERLELMGFDRFVRICAGEAELG